MGVLEGVGTHTQHEITRNHTQRADFPPPTAEQGSNDVKSGGNYVTIPARAASQYYLLKSRNFRSGTGIGFLRVWKLEIAQNTGSWC